MIGSTSGTNDLVLGPSATAGTLSGIGTSFTHFNKVVVFNGATWTLTGANTVASPSYLADDGALTNAGSLSASVTLGNGASLTNAAGATIISVAPVYGSGSDVVNYGTIAGAGARRPMAFI